MMKKGQSKSLPKIKTKINAKNKQTLPLISSKQIPISINKNQSFLTERPKVKSILSPTIIDKSSKNLLLMKKINPINRNNDSSSDEQGNIIMRKLQSGQGNRLKAELVILKKNQDKRSYLKQQYVKQSLVGEQAIIKFYQRYKKFDKLKQKQDYLNQKHVITSIVALLQLHNFTPRKLTLVKIKGEQAILDLKKLGLGQGSMGPVVSQIINCLQNFQHVDLSYNRIDGLLSQSFIQKLGRAKMVDLSHNRIGKLGCQKICQLFLTSTTKIQQLNLQQNGLIDNVGVLVIQQLLRYNNLKKLKLSKNFLGLKFASKLKEILSSGEKKLLQLYLSWNEFGTKGMKNILQGILSHSYLKVVDLSWNKIQQQNIDILAKIFKQSQNLIHADFSFCQMSIKSIQKLSMALKDNHQLFGTHFQGNSGYIDYKGFLNKTDKQFGQYPLPIIKGIIRRIDGVRPYPDNQYKDSSNRDVCWICNSWQQRYFQYPVNNQIKQLLNNGKQEVQCFIHFKHEGYRAAKMQLNVDKTQFQILRMCPIGILQFFFTISQGISYKKFQIHSQYSKIDQSILLNFSIGQVKLTQNIKQRNYYNCQYDADVINEQYEPNVSIRPRFAEVGYRQGQKIIMKRKVLKQQKVQMNFKNVDNQDDQFLKDKNNRDEDEQFIKKCIQFDIQNSKIKKLIKQENLINQFKLMMRRYYRNFKDAFYYLSKNNPSSNSIFSISQLQFSGFLEQQKYITKRVTLPKIMLKLYACLSVGDQQQIKNKNQTKKNQQKSINKLISRPQFLQFLIRLALQKWCSFNPKKNKKIQKKSLLNEDEQILNKKNNKKQSKINNKEKVSQHIKKQQQQKPVEQQQSQQQQQGNKKVKLNLPLPIIEGIQKTMTSLIKYAEYYRSSNWRRNLFLKGQVLIVIKAYQQFLISLYDKYSESKFKTNKPKKLFNLLTLDQLRNLILDTDIRRTKQAMKQIQQSFIQSKKLQIQDGNLQYGLNLQQFYQCLARVSQYIWFNPPTLSDPDFWRQQSYKKATPLFIKFQAFIVALYWRTPDLHNKRMTKIVEKGIFQLQMQIIKQKIIELGQKIKYNGNIKMNSINGQSVITLKQVIQQLKQKYQNMVVVREQQQQYETNKIMIAQRLNKSTQIQNQSHYPNSDPMEDIPPMSEQVRTIINRKVSSYLHSKINLGISPSKQILLGKKLKPLPKQFGQYRNLFQFLQDERSVYHLYKQKIDRNMDQCLHLYLKMLTLTIDYQCRISEKQIDSESSVMIQVLLFISMSLLECGADKAAAYFSKIGVTFCQYYKILHPIGQFLFILAKIFRKLFRYKQSIILLKKALQYNWWIDLSKQQQINNKFTKWLNQNSPEQAGYYKQHFQVTRSFMSQLNSFKLQPKKYSQLNTYKELLKSYFEIKKISTEVINYTISYKKNQNTQRSKRSKDLQLQIYNQMSYNFLQLNKKQQSKIFAQKYESGYIQTADSKIITLSSQLIHTVQKRVAGWHRMNKKTFYLLFYQDVFKILEENKLKLRNFDQQKIIKYFSINFDGIIQNIFKMEIFKYQIPLPLQIKKQPTKQKKSIGHKFIMRNKSNSNITKPLPKVIIKPNLDKIQQNLLFNFRGIGFSRIKLLDIFNRFVQQIKKRQKQGSFNIISWNKIIIQ